MDSLTRLTPRLFSFSEGIPAIFCGIYTFFYLPNYPDTSTFLSEDEKQAIISNLPATQPSSLAKTWDWEQARTLLRDPTFYTFTLLWICHAIGGWGVSTVLPTVIYELGLTGTAVAQLMTMVSLTSTFSRTAGLGPSKFTNNSSPQPTYAFGCACLVLIGYLIHRKYVSPWLAAIASMSNLFPSPPLPSPIN